MKAGREIRVRPRVIEEVMKSQLGQMHAGKMNCKWKFGRLGTNLDVGVSFVSRNSASMIYEMAWKSEPGQSL